MADLRVVLTHPQASLPARAHPTDAGLDLAAVENSSLAAGTVRTVKTGLKIAIPKGYEGQVRPRSGLAAKHGVTVLNAPGTIDSTYRGEVKVILINHSAKTFEIKPGMRIAQLVVAPVSLLDVRAVDSLDETPRGTGGLGSTGLESV